MQPIFKPNDVLFHPNANYSCDIIVIQFAFQMSEGVCYFVDYAEGNGLICDYEIGPNAVKIGEL